MRAKVANVPPINDPMAAIPEGRPRPALFGHLVAVKTSDHRGRLSGDIDQDGGDGPSIHGAVVNGGQHDDGADGVQIEGDGDQNRGSGGRSQPRQNADQGAEDAADQGEHQVDRQSGNGKSLDPVL